MKKVKVNGLYYFDPCMFDKINGNSTEMFTKGQQVRVINKYGCPKANTMGQCYIVAADAPKHETHGYERTPFAMVSVHSLEKEPPSLPDCVCTGCIAHPCKCGQEKESQALIGAQ